MVVRKAPEAPFVMTRDAFGVSRTTAKPPRYRRSAQPTSPVAFTLVVEQALFERSEADRSEASMVSGERVVDRRETTNCSNGLCP